MGVEGLQTGRAVVIAHVAAGFYRSVRHLRREAVLDVENRHRIGRQYAAAAGALFGPKVLPMSPVIYVSGIDQERLEAPPGFEPGMEVLQTSALPLGDGAGWNCVRG
jgi:hypothetical protein